MKYHPTSESNTEERGERDTEMQAHGSSSSIPDDNKDHYKIRSLYKHIRGLAAEALINLDYDRELSETFLSNSVQDALSILEIEISLLYNVLHTKALLINRPRRVFYRLICFLSLIAATVLFSITSTKKNFESVDVEITFALLLGAVLLELTGVVRFLISDWFIIKLEGLQNYFQKNSHSKSMVSRWWARYLSQIEWL